MARICTCQIKIAVIGNVSVGKTTLLNALFRNKFSQVSMKRTTAGVNCFRVFIKQQHETNRNTNGNNDTSPSNENTNEMEDENEALLEDDDKNNEPQIRTAESILLEITEDNQRLRDSNIAEEKTFDIELSDNLFETRKDTQLVFVDIPGIECDEEVTYEEGIYEELGASQKYKRYIADQWGTFDCVVLVMDIRHGVNTEWQVALLEFAKQNCDTTREIPIIILCNKVDDPEDEELCSMLKEIQLEVMEIFKSSILEKDHIFNLMQQSRKEKMDSEFWKQPVFISLAAMQAFTFRCASLMSFQQFKQLDQDIVDKIGRERIGREQWRKLVNKNAERRALYDLIMDQDSYHAAIQESNFDTFLTALELLVGGENNQRLVIERQIQHRLDVMSSFGKLARPLYNIFRMQESLNEKQGPNQFVQLRSYFWKLFDQKFSRTLEEYDESAQHVTKLVELLDDLQEMGDIAIRIDAKEMQEEIYAKAENLVRRQIGCTISHFQCHRKKRPDPSVEDPSPWSDLTAVDWSRIIRNILQVANHPVFWRKFGREMRELELMYNMVCTCILESTQEYRYGSCPAKTICFGVLDFHRTCNECSLWLKLVKGLDGKSFNLGVKKCVGTRDLRRRNKRIQPGTERHTRKVCSNCIDPCYRESSSDNEKVCTKCLVDDEKIEMLEAQFAPPDRYFCIQCDKEPLDFNRKCKKCNVYYCLPGSLRHQRCPKQYTNVDCTGSLSEEGECSKCLLIFKELPGNLESLLTVKAEDGKIVPDFPEIYNYFVGLDITDSLSDPKHFGHVAWRYCVWMESIPLKERE